MKNSNKMKNHSSKNKNNRSITDDRFNKAVHKILW